MSNKLQAAAKDDGVSIHSGFPNPATDHYVSGPRLALDINQLLVKHPSATYLFRVAGHTNADQGINDGDVVVIDRALNARPGDLVVAWQDDNFVICRQHHLTAADQFWGVVVAIIHQFRQS